MELRFDFADDDALTGFRLARFDFFNWGTYDAAIYSLDLEKRNALLTGDIGSGKSTIVDALTTLLVPHSRIVYNKAAGAESRERTLYSYIVGEYKSVKDDTFGSARAASLRKAEETFSVLLARFENDGYDEQVTLVQFFWISNNQVKKFYLTSLSDISIKKDFFGFQDIRELKRRLKKLPHTNLYESFREYAQDFRRTMGIKNEQALNLFYQTVSLKAIGNLTEFIRKHMLESTEIDTQVDDLCHNFSELNRAHNLILEAQNQIELLAPIDKEAVKHEKSAEQREELGVMRSLLEAYFADFRVVLLQKKLSELELERDKVTSKKRHSDEETERFNTEVLNLKIELQRNGADRLNHIENEIRQLEIAVGQKQREKQRYDQLAKQLGFPVVSSEHRFLKNREEALQYFDTTETESTKLQNEKVLNAVTLRRYEEQIGKLDGEIDYLKKHRSNIPQHNARIRESMAGALGLKDDDLPFAGELIRATDSKWEGAVERVLHHFALSLIVDTRYYEDVSRYVEQTNLGGRLVYLKVDIQKAGEQFDGMVADSLMQKIEVKADSPYEEELKVMLFDRFNITCVETLEAFRRQKRALTIHGQFKTSLMRHEKDDRFDLQDRSRWVLGWENAQKLEALKNERSTVTDKYTILLDQNNLIDEKLLLLRQRRDALRDLSSIEHYELIDWYRPSRHIEELDAEKRELQESSNIIAELRKRLEKYELRRQESMKSSDTLALRLGKLEQSINDREAEHDNAVLLAESSEALPQYRNVLDTYSSSIAGEELSLTTITPRESEVRRQMTNEIDLLDKRIGRSREKMVAQMKEFVNAFPVVSKEFDAAVEAVGEYRKKLAELKRNDLPRWRKRFKTLLKEKMVQHIIVLQNRLEYQGNEIKTKIEAINDSLQDIEYDEGTYIELIAEPVKTVQIRTFKESLKSAVSGAIGEDNSYDEQKFLQIKEMIERFNGREGHSDEDKKWRKTVTDVRNWFEFSAVEKYLSNGDEKEYYTDSGGKSGGQKEKLAYTVLASSLAFQFGLEHNRIKSRSFRFVMIDEAFGRGSDESTRYGLRLFEKLNLQLLVITPKQKINVIEPYVKTVHFVHNREGMESSLVSMRIEEFQERKEQ